MVAIKVCECHLIDWSGTPKYIDNGQETHYLTSPDCQSKVNRGEFTYEDYECLCIMYDEDVLGYESEQDEYEILVYPAQPTE